MKGIFFILLLIPSLSFSQSFSVQPIRPCDNWWYSSDADGYICWIRPSTVYIPDVGELQEVITSLQEQIDDLKEQIADLK